MDVKIWGPSTWRAIHSIAMGFDQRHPSLLTDLDRSSARSFFESLECLLPCSSCRSSYAALMSSEWTRRAMDDAIQNGRLFAWTVGLHNEVNSAADSPRPPMSVEAARAELLSPPRDPAPLMPIPWSAVCCGGAVVASLAFILVWGGRRRGRV